VQVWPRLAGCSERPSLYNEGVADRRLKATSPQGGSAEPGPSRLSVLATVRSMSHDFSLGTVEVASSPLERFEEFLQSRGKRGSKQRRIIVEQVFSRHDHFDADDLLAHLQRVVGARQVSRPTVYRTLSELVDAGLLRQMTLNGRSVYEHDYGYPQHDHLYCQRCEKLIEFSSDEVKAIRDAVGREHHFRVLGHRLIITGICQECSRTKRRTQPLDLI
jgi:Fur family ferric uptake transcriptional regulator